ncbi:ArsR family transcriptional regulator [Candidatus Woesearchaeota archaeon]|nr:ArsR family transcriptional regulator [Candidatus Woesearchaeota archaeon]
MITRFKRLTLVKVRIPDDNLNSEVQWFSESFGLFSQRDKDKSCFRLFIALLQAKRPMSSNELAYKLNLSRATVIHHLNKLISCGLIIIEGNKYILREKNLELSLKRIKEDLISTFEEMEAEAKRIDKKLKN